MPKELCEARLIEQPKRGFKAYSNVNFDDEL